MRGERFLRRVRAELRLSGLAAWRGLVALLNSNDLTHAASIAYYALLSLFPFLLLVISILGSVTADDADRLAVLTFVFRYFPTQFDFVTSQLDALARQRASSSAWRARSALIWASLGVFGAITSAVNEAWGVEKQRSFLKHRLVSFLMLVAGGGVMIVALLLVSADSDGAGLVVWRDAGALHVASSAADADSSLFSPTILLISASGWSSTSFRTPRPGFATSGSAQS